MQRYRFNRKMILSQPVFKIAMLLNAAVFLFLFFYQRSRTIQWIGYYAFLEDSFNYFEVFYMILFFAVAVYFGQIPGLLEESCLMPRNKLLFWRFCALLSCACLTLLLPVGFVCIGAVIEKVSFLYFSRSLLWALMRYFAILSLSISFGFFCGSLCKRYYIYLLALPYMLLFSYLNEGFLSWLVFGKLGASWETSNALSQFFSLNSPFPHGWFVDYAGASQNAFFWLGITNTLLLALSLFVGLMLVVSKKRRLRTGAVFLCSLALLGSSVFGYFKVYPTEYGAKCVETNYRPAAYHISSYEANVDIGSPCAVDCDIIIQRQSKDKLVLKIDGAFEDCVLSINGIELPYTRNGDRVTVEKEHLPTEDEFLLHAEYRGRVFYAAGGHLVDIFACEDGTAAFPPCVALLPQIANDNVLHDYYVTVTGTKHMTVISNLEQRKTEEGICFSGISDSFLLFSGFFREVQYGDVTVYMSAYNESVNIEERLDFANSLGCFLDGHSGNVINGEFRPKKLFILTYHYDTGMMPVMYHDYGIINFNY